MGEFIIPTLDDVFAVLGAGGHRPILLYIDKGSKAPNFPGWQNTTYEH